MNPFLVRSLMTGLARLGLVSSVLAAWCAWASGDATPQDLRIVFPQDPAILDAKRDLGAKGDGVSDDTAALQRGLEASSGGDGPTRILYLPNGVYRLSQTLVVKSAIGPWVYGESRDGVVLRMVDGVTNRVPDCTSVLRTHPSDTQASSADFFMRNIRNLTIDAGDNPSLDGVRWYGNNSSALKNVKVRGNGRVGVNAGFIGQNGPNLVQDVTIEGFDTGIRSAWCWGGTFSRITVRRARTEAIYINANAVGIEDLRVEDSPRALRNEFPNDWTWWGGVVALIGGDFVGGPSNAAAITNSSVLYARDVRSSGFARVLASATSSGDVAGNEISEYLSHPVTRLFDNSPPRGLRLPILPEPNLAWETNTDRWVGAHAFGAVAGDNRDDTAALQAAIDAAAREGKSTVHLRGIGGGDPNWFTLDGEVHVHGSVRHIVALGFGRVVAGEHGRFVVDDRSAPVVKFQNLQAFGGRPATLENRSQSRTVVAEGCDFRILGTGRGDLFLTDCPSRIELRSSGQCLWARQLNPEGTDDVGLVRNRGGILWALGVKHEGAGVRVMTEAGGRTELFGVFNYGPGNIKPEDPRPAFEVRNASFSAMGVREISFGKDYPVKLQETRGKEVRSVKGGGWIGWALYSGLSGTSTNSAPMP